jgi:DnaJ domain
VRAACEHLCIFHRYGRVSPLNRLLLLWLGSLAICTTPPLFNDPLLTAKYATSILQTLYYRLNLPAGTATPQPGTPLYALHHRRIRTLVLCLYLIYTLLQSLYDVRLAGDFYMLLSLTPTSSDREIRARFRRLAAKHHPDKTPSSTDTTFIHLKLASDTLLNPSLRFAYDRFGPAITAVTHPHLKTIQDYVYAGLRAKVPEYASNFVFLIVLNYIWLPPWGQYWRYFAVAVMAFLELYFLTHIWTAPALVTYLGTATHKAFPDLLPPHLLPFQILSIARKLSMSLNIFISQLAPPSAPSRNNIEQQNQQQLAHLSQTANRLDAEVAGLLQLGLTPFKGDREKTKRLREGMRESLMMNAVRNSPEVRQAVQGALDRRSRIS